MTREDKDSLVEMLSKVSVTETKGSLLSAIGNLLRVIDVSESSIMIPTLLKDNCEFDAYEILTLAKVLKASILGHNDLVELYMSESSSPSLSASSTTSSTCSSSSSSSSSSSTTPTSNKDPDATVRLLLHIEQLKTFIPQVTGLFESIIELYKNSVDTITYGGHSHK